jgi:hypothetical protein
MGEIDYDSGLYAARQDGYNEGCRARVRQEMLDLLNQGLSIEEMKKRLS